MQDNTKLPPKFLKRFLDNYKVLKKWVESVYEHGLSLGQQELNDIDYKRVPKYGHRKWNVDNVEQCLLDAGVKPGDIAKALSSPAQAQKFVSAEVVNKLCVRPEIGEKLVATGSTVETFESLFEGEL